MISETTASTWARAATELGWGNGDPQNIGWYCSDRICRQGRASVPALIWENHAGEHRTYTFDQLRDRSDAIAHFLRTLGLGPRERICLFLDRVPELYIGFLGVLKMGGVAQPLFSAFVHLKDHFVTPDPDGFLLWDAALGEGVLDLAEMVRVLRHVSPQASFNLEVITRDPLKIPIHTDAYWATLPGRREGNLEWISAMLEKSPPPTYAPPIAALDHKQQMALEMGHCRRSVSYAQERLQI